MAPEHELAQPDGTSAVANNAIDGNNIQEKQRSFLLTNLIR